MHDYIIFDISIPLETRAAKPIEFLGDSLARIRAFPVEGRQRAGYQLQRVQEGHEPDDWKPMRTAGRGVREIRIREEAGAFRVIYIASLPDAVYVLHAFQKKTRKTARGDLDLAAARFAELMKRTRS